MVAQQQNAIDSVLKQIEIIHGVKTINGDINLSFLWLSSLPDLSDVILNGDLYCDCNHFFSLQGCPKVINGAFDCSYNNITSLKYCPTIIHGDFDCSNNKLTSLQYTPTSIDGYFKCNDNQLTSLQYAPEQIDGIFQGYNNHWPKDLSISSTLSSKEYSALIYAHTQKANPVAVTSINIEI